MIIKTFENFKKFENTKPVDISVLYDFRNKPLLGGYILDTFENNLGSIGIKISTEPDTKQVPFVDAGKVSGKKTEDFEILETIIYWIEENEWNLGKLQYKKTPEDEKLLAEIASKLK
jgi:hypothetical protein